MNKELLWYHKLPLYEFGDMRSVNFAKLCLKIQDAFQHMSPLFLTLDFFRTSFRMIQMGISPRQIIIPEMSPHVALYHKLMSCTSQKENSIRVIYTPLGFEHYVTYNMNTSERNRLVSINADYMGDVRKDELEQCLLSCPNLEMYSVTRYLRGTYQPMPHLPQFVKGRYNKSNKVISQIFVSQKRKWCNTLSNDEEWMYENGELIVPNQNERDTYLNETNSIRLKTQTKRRQIDITSSTFIRSLRVD